MVGINAARHAAAMPRATIEEDAIGRDGNVHGRIRCTTAMLFEPGTSARIWIFGARGEPIVLADLRGALSGWRVTEDKSTWVARPTGFRAMREGATLAIRVLEGGEARRLILEQVRVLE